MGCTSSKQGRRGPPLPPIDRTRSLPPPHHVVSLTSSTLGILNLNRPDDDEMIMKAANDRHAAAWSEMIDRRFPNTPPHETINAWELMAGLEDHHPTTTTIPAVRRSQSFGNDREITTTTAGIVKARVTAFQERINARSISRGKTAPTSPVRNSAPPPPAGKRKAVVVLYFTSLRGVPQTYEDCSTVQAILRSYGVRVDERDVSLHAGFREELKEMAGAGRRLPRVFAGGRYLGGAEEVKQMHESGELGKAMEGCEMMTVGKGGVGERCRGCGDVRFVPCDKCSGSCKMYVEEEEEEEEGVGFRRCAECNENGLVRCPLCC